MTLKYAEEFRDPVISQKLIDKIKKISRKEIRLMEVCGTHTMAIFRSGIRSLLPNTIQLISGPGCPVCVTAQKEIDAFLSLAGRDEVIVTTFGDLMRVPGTRSSLQKERASGRDIRMVYSTFDALDVAQKNPGKTVVFLGVGFETTAPTIAASIQSAKQMNIDNYTVFSAHKLVPPALAALMEMKSVNIDGFLLPGHVSVIIGMNAYQPVVDKYRIPAVIAGFEPTDILQAVCMLVEQVEAGRVRLANAYKRAVSAGGNNKAQKIMGDVFETVDMPWRGIGTIPESGLKIKKEYAAFDAEEVFEITVMETEEPKGCVCGEILTGLKTPPDCSLFRKVCTPMDPVGACMVSSEGTCAAYYRYHHDE
ncbi:MAG: hydrogenase formation protein HypD [Deltaproteobacteria bacterium]|nr:hydrogenase formation protein HypD [Deltaproteobacteria bacterium]MBW2200510.1 hydrogenase formation protein HypD [Deltaproteobacteria bacterium]